VREQVSHPYKTIGKTIVLYILIFVFKYHYLRDSIHTATAFLLQKI
jgi:hypothetical protein